MHTNLLAHRQPQKYLHQRPSNAYGSYIGALVIYVRCGDILQILAGLHILCLNLGYWILLLHLYIMT